MSAEAPIGIQIAGKCCTCLYKKKTACKIFILAYTFIIYITYHMSRLPISVVKSVLHRNCTKAEVNKILQSPPYNQGANTPNTTDLITATKCSWVPFEGENYKELYGTLDYVFLLCYAVGLFISGQIAERTHIRYFLTVGMVSSGLFVMLFGLGRQWHIHSFAYYLTMQIFTGFFQSTGWPCVVTCVANWFGDSKKGLIMGIWNIHTNIGNTLGALIPGIWVKSDWSLSFIVPGLIILGAGLTVLFLLIPYPAELGHSTLPSLDAAAGNDGGDDVTKPTPDTAKTPTENSNLLKADGDKEKAITFCGALKIPGVVEFSLGLFFVKLVSYTFLFWLPKYIASGGSVEIDPHEAASLTAFFDVGAIFGGIAMGLAADLLGLRAVLCVFFLIFSTGPMFQVYRIDGSTAQGSYIAFLLITGFFTNGPYALITTLVSAELGVHPSLKGNAKAISTVTAIIDGTGSLGAATGPFLTGFLATYGWGEVFIMLIVSVFLGALCMSHLFVIETREACKRFATWWRRKGDTAVDGSPDNDQLVLKPKPAGTTDVNGAATTSSPSEDAPVEGHDLKNK